MFSSFQSIVLGVPEAWRPQRLPTAVGRLITRAKTRAKQSLKSGSPDTLRVSYSRTPVTSPTVEGTRGSVAEPHGATITNHQIPSLTLPGPIGPRLLRSLLASGPSAVKQEPRSVRTCVTRNGKAR